MTHLYSTICREQVRSRWWHRL